MAQKVEVVLTCDLDVESTPAIETVVFGYGGQTYEFELCQAHLKEFHEVMQRFASGARPAGGRRGGPRARTARAGRSARIGKLRRRGERRAQGRVHLLPVRTSDRSGALAAARGLFRA